MSPQVDLWRPSLGCGFNQRNAFNLKPEGMTEEARPQDPQLYVLSAPPPHSSRFLMCSPGQAI